MAQSSQGFAVNASGQLIVDVETSIFSGVTGSAVPAQTVLVGGSDGTDIRSLLTSATGQLHVIADSGSTTVVTGTVAANITQVAGVTLGSTAVTNFGTAPAAAAVPGVNASIFQGTAAIAVANPLFTEISDGAAAMGTMANFGTSPTAVKALNANASIFSGTTALTNTAGSLNVNITGGSSSSTQYNNGSTPTPPIVGTAVEGTDSAGTVHVLNTTTNGDLNVIPAAPATSQLTHVVISSNATGDITIVAGVGGKTIRIMEIHIQLSGLTTTADSLVFKDGAGTNLTGVYSFRNGGEFGRENNGDPLFITSSSNAFIINQTVAAQISGYCKYTIS